MCIQLTNSSYDDCENMCTLSYYHHQIRSMTHLPLFRVRLWYNAILYVFLYSYGLGLGYDTMLCCMSFYILMVSSHMRRAVAERRRADFDITVLPQWVCSQILRADTGGSAISWDKDGLECTISKRMWKIRCWAHLLRSGFFSWSTSAQQLRMVECM